MRVTGARLCLVASVVLAGCAIAPEPPSELEMTTWSVVGVDPATGDVGVAVASCVPTHGDAVAALVARHHDADAPGGRPFRVLAHAYPRPTAAAADTGRAGKSGTALSLVTIWLWLHALP